MIERIPLYARDGSIRAHALVDEADYAMVAQHRWHLDTGGYVRTRWGNEKLRLHRWLLGLEPGDARVGDHINGDRLDNRRVNLRSLDVSVHSQNQRVVTVKSSRYRGVCWDRGRRTGRWRARVRIGDRRIHIGYFEDERDAALAVDAFRREHMPYAQPDPALA